MNYAINTAYPVIGPTPRHVDIYNELARYRVARQPVRIAAFTEVFAPAPNNWNQVVRNNVVRALASLAQALRMTNNLEYYMVASGGTALSTRNEYVAFIVRTNTGGPNTAVNIQKIGTYYKFGRNSWKQHSWTTQPNARNLGVANSNHVPLRLANDAIADYRFPAFMEFNYGVNNLNTTIGILHNRKPKSVEAIAMLQAVRGSMACRNNASNDQNPIHLLGGDFNAAPLANTGSLEYISSQNNTTVSNNYDWWVNEHNCIRQKWSNNQNQPNIRVSVTPTNPVRRNAPQRGYVTGTDHRGIGIYW